MSAPNRIQKLIETFDYNLEAYRKGAYNETQVRREFIDPFFEELGWDITNKQGHAEAYKDVIHEDAIKVGGVTKAPDYCFRVGGTRKFFCSKNGIYRFFSMEAESTSAYLSSSTWAISGIPS